MREEFLFNNRKPISANKSRPSYRNRTERSDVSGLNAVLAQALKKSKLLKVVAVFVAVLAFVFFVANLIYKDIKPYYVLELGDPFPSANVFMKTGGQGATYASDLSGVNVNVEGTHFIKVSHGSESRHVVLMVRDTTAPSAESKELNISIDDSLEITDLIYNISDNSRIFASWVSKPKFGTAGSYVSKIKLRDEYDNINIIETVVNIRAVVDEIEYEAGTEFPQLNRVLLVHRDDAFFVHTPSDSELKTPGVYKLVTEIDGKKYTTDFRVKDTVAPYLELKPLLVGPGEKPEFDLLIENVEDATELKFEYDTELDVNKTGIYPVTVKATDLGGNSVSVEGSIAVAHSLELEARKEPLKASEIARVLGVSPKKIVLAEEIIPNIPGINIFNISLSGEEETFAIIVQDTTAPTAVAVPVEWFAGYPLEPKDFVSEVEDASKVEVSFVNEPDFNLIGTQNIELLLKDAGGNETGLSTTLTLHPDTEPPVLYNVKDRFAYVDGNVFYLDDIWVEDNADKDVEIEVKKPFVNPHKEGQYSVTYIARDKAGNESSKTCNFIFIPQKVSDDALEALRNEIYAEIFTDNMSIAQKLKAVFDYIFTNVVYRNSSDKSDWKSEAYRGLTQGQGDCFTFYSVSHLLLSGLDCELMSVRRVNGSTDHYWCYVNIGNGWYHFDTCNVGAGSGGYCFMRTSEEILTRGPYYWNFDLNMLPPSATVPFAQTDLGK